jgi:hypothetical protein
MMRVKITSWVTLSVIMILTPSSLIAGGEKNDEKRNVVTIRRINVRPRPASTLSPYDLKEKSTNLVSLRGNAPTLITPLTPQEKTEPENTFRLFLRVKKNTSLLNK